MMSEWPFISAFTVAIADATSQRARKVNRPGPISLYKKLLATWEWQLVSGLYKINCNVESCGVSLLLYTYAYYINIMALDLAILYPKLYYLWYNRLINLVGKPTIRHTLLNEIIYKLVS